jgi:hypothetical protein
MLLPGARTTSLSFNIPLQINEALIHGFEKKKNSNKVAFFIKTKLSIWDETPMINRY